MYQPPDGNVDCCLCHRGFNQAQSRLAKQGAAPPLNLRWAVASPGRVVLLVDMATRTPTPRRRCRARPADVTFPSEAIALGQAEPHLAKLLRLAKRDSFAGRFLQRRAQAELAAQATAPQTELLNTATHAKDRSARDRLFQPGIADRLANAIAAQARFRWPGGRGGLRHCGDV